MTGQQLKNSILQEAIQGRLVPNVLEPGEKTGAEILQAILLERQEQEKKEKGKKAKKLTLSIIEEEPWELPDSWCWCKLADIGSWGAGATPQRGNSSFYQGGIIPWLKTGELNNGIVYDTEEKVTALALEKCSLRLCQPGDVLIAMYGATIGKLAIAGVPLTTNQACCACSPYFGIYNKYLFFFLLAKKEDFTKQAFGGAQPNISKEKIVRTDFPLPPPSIQKAIVEKIETLFPLVEEFDKAAGELKALNEALPDKLRKSVLQEAIHGNLVPSDIPDGEATAQELLQQVLKERQDRENKAKGKKAKKLLLSTIEDEPWELPEGWCWCSIGDICEIVNGFTPLRSNPSFWSNPTIPWFTVDDIREQGRIISTTKQSISTNALAKESNRLLPKNTVLLCCTASLGEYAITKIEVTTNQQFNGLIVPEALRETVLPYYLFSIMPYFKDILNDICGKTTFGFVSVSKVSKILLPLPPLSVQHRIVDKIEEVFSAINELQLND